MARDLRADWIGGKVNQNFGLVDLFQFRPESFLKSSRVPRGSSIYRAPATGSELNPPYSNFDLSIGGAFCNLSDKGGFEKTLRFAFFLLDWVGL